MISGVRSMVAWAVSSRANSIAEGAEAAQGELLRALIGAGLVGGSLELLAEGGELLLDFREFAAEAGYFFLQVRDAIGSGA